MPLINSFLIFSDIEIPFTGKGKVRGEFNKFPDFFFLLAFKIGANPCKFSMLLLCIFWDDWPVFMISGLNEHLQQQLEYTLLKPDCHS